MNPTKDSQIQDLPCGLPKSWYPPLAGFIQHARLIISLCVEQSLRPLRHKRFYCLALPVIFRIINISEPHKGILLKPFHSRTIPHECLIHSLCIRLINHILSLIFLTALLVNAFEISSSRLAITSILQSSQHLPLFMGSALFP